MATIKIVVVVAFVNLCLAASGERDSVSALQIVN